MAIEFFHVDVANLLTLFGHATSAKVKKSIRPASEYYVQELPSDDQCD